VKDFPKIKLPESSIESEGPTPVQFLPSAMLSWRAPSTMLGKMIEQRPEPPQNSGVAGR
jgi:hypothetical protein